MKNLKISDLLLNIIKKNGIKFTFFSFLLLVCVASSAYALTPIDISTWKQEGFSDAGNWIMQPDGSVLQDFNYWWIPSFFVSPETYINTTITAKMRVGSVGDDDYIGLVFGYNAPLAEHSNPYNKLFDFIVFDWKQAYQNFYGITWPAGFSLARVNGNFGGDTSPYFHGHLHDPPKYDLLATDLGPDRGWEDYVEHTVTLLYHTDRIKIDVAGGKFGSGETIFDISGSFPEGRIGFYNYCQPYAFYYDVMEENNIIPEPSSMILLGAGLFGAGLFRKIKKKR